MARGDPITYFMSFPAFIEHLQGSLQQTLPGEQAQYLMAPHLRATKEQLISLHPQYRKSGVMVLIYPVNDVPHLALTKRTTYDGAHSGQVSFPGGRQEEFDPSLAETALRETSEEIGIPAKLVQLHGQLTELYIPASRFVVYPFVGSLPDKPNFVRDKKEVEKVMDTQLSALLNPILVKTTRVTIFDGREIETPYFDFHGEIIWGATAMILSELAELMKQHSLEKYL